LISDFRRDLNIVYFLLGISPAYCTPSLWRWNWYRVPKRRPTTIWRRGATQKKIYNHPSWCSFIEAVNWLLQIQQNLYCTARRLFFLMLY